MTTCLLLLPRFCSTAVLIDNLIAVITIINIAYITFILITPPPHAGRSRWLLTLGPVFLWVFAS